jgi:hypothetical protein
VVFALRQHRGGQLCHQSTWQPAGNEETAEIQAEDHLLQKLTEIPHWMYLWVYLIFDYLDKEVYTYQQTIKGSRCAGIHASRHRCPLGEESVTVTHARLRKASFLHCSCCAAASTEVLQRYVLVKWLLGKKTPQSRTFAWKRARTFRNAYTSAAACCYLYTMVESTSCIRQRKNS